MATFNEDHLKELKKARPDYIPPGKHNGASPFPRVGALGGYFDILCVSVSVNQIEATLAKQRKEIVEYCREEGIMIETALPLCRGYRVDRYKLIAVAQR